MVFLNYELVHKYDVHVVGFKGAYCRFKLLSENYTDANNFMFISSKDICLCFIRDINNIINHNKYYDFIIISHAFFLLRIITVNYY